MIDSWDPTFSNLKWKIKLQYTFEGDIKSRENTGTHLREKFHIGFDPIAFEVH